MCSTFENQLTKLKKYKMQYIQLAKVIYIFFHIYCNVTEFDYNHIYSNIIIFKQMVNQTWNTDFKVNLLLYYPQSQEYTYNQNKKWD